MGKSRGNARTLPSAAEAGQRITRTRRFRMLRIVAVVLVLVLVGFAAVAALDLRIGFGRLLLPAAPSAAVYQGPECRTDPHANVYVGLRLVLIRPCVKIEGVVFTAEHAPDGDLHIGLYLPPTDVALIDEDNVLQRGGRLVVEVVPADQVGCTPGRPPAASDQPAKNLGTCTGANIASPASNDLISIIGAYVIDAQYGWTEVHPVWSLTVLAHHQPLPSAPTTAQALPRWFDWTLQKAQSAEAHYHGSSSRLVQLLHRLLR
jgi:hypothetical protein